jgi:tight adherence protein C
MIYFIAIFTFICVTLAVIGLYRLTFGRSKTHAHRLKSSSAAKAAGSPKEEESVVDLVERIVKPLNRIVPPSLTEANKLQRTLMKAGYISHRAPVIFRGVQLASMVVLPGIVALICMLFGVSFSGVAMGSLLAFAIGFLVPRFVLKRLIKRRQERLSWGLADALDLMVVSMEAGLGMNQAMVRVSEELIDAHREISEEFDLVNLEIRVGRDRVEALNNLCERTGVDDLRSFVTMLVQADRFGTSIGRAVRQYSDQLRTKRRQRAEQAAQKASVKLLLPLTCFLFPTLFIVILGPAGISIIDSFSGSVTK